MASLRVVAPFGFYGFGNTGDEATLQGFARLLGGWRRVPRPWVASRNPAHTARVEPAFHYFRDGRETWRKRWAIKWSNAFVFAGGTPIADSLGTWPLDVVDMLVQEANVRRRAVGFVGIGTEGLTQAASKEILSRSLAPAVVHWTVRSRRDRERLTSWGVPAERVDVAADMAWSLTPVDSSFGRRELEAVGVPTDKPVVGVNVNNERVILEREPGFFDNVAACLDEVTERHGAHVVFFCSEVRTGAEYDQAAAQLVMDRMQHKARARLVRPRYFSPQELMSVIACCQAVMSTRYHVCLFSALQSVPFVALKRSDKVADLCEDTGWSIGLRLGEISRTALGDCLEEAMSRRADLGATLSRARAERAEATLRNRSALEALASRV